MNRNQENARLATSVVGGTFSTWYFGKPIIDMLTGDVTGSAMDHYTNGPVASALNSDIMMNSVNNGIEWEYGNVLMAEFFIGGFVLLYTSKQVWNHFIGKGTNDSNMGVARGF